ncbi:MAG: FHA domain-containing protein [Pseudomonadota bacterium]
MRFEILQNGQVLETKTLTEGQYHVGRSESCEICLKSTRVSKQHALIVIKGSQVAIIDSGSANGIFVNGVLIKKQRINHGDLISIGDYQIRYLRPFPKKQSAGGVFNITQGNLARKSETDYVPSEEEIPKQQVANPQEQFARVVDQKVLIPFYGLMKVADWRWILGTLIISALALSVLLAARPIYVWATGLAEKEALDRAHSIVNQIVRENFRSLQKGGDYARLSVDPWESVRGFKEIYILDGQNGNILAPVKLFNKTLNDSYALVAFRRVVDERAAQITIEHPDGGFILAQPVPQSSIESANELNLGPAAVVLVNFTATESITSVFEPVLEALIFAVFLGLLAYYLIIKMVTRPLQQIQEQLDAALRGEPVSINCDVKFPDLENLAQVINFSVARLRQSNPDLSRPLTDADTDSEDNLLIKTVEELDIGTGDGLLLLDKEKKVKFVGHILEDLIGLKYEYAKGQNISDCCRDPGFAGTTIDLSERVVSSLGETQEAVLDINGTNRPMVAVGHRSQSGEIRFVLITVRMTGS